ncbi:MAG: plastocyanin/azurin family copper-binding protein [Usitatibacter sp.]
MSARLIGSALCSLLLSGAAYAATPAQSLGIKLKDSSTDPSLAHMRMVVDHATLKPGRVTLQAENQSKTLVHEVIVVRDDGAKDLPFDAKQGRVIEERIRRLGEIADLAPGKTGKLTLNLKSGTYLLICNQPGHYKDGMLAKVIVAP